MIHSNFQCEFYFIRHGESESNATPGFAAGVNFDAPLTPLGFDQAEMLGRRFKDEGMRFDRIYSSSMTRTLQTTETMLKAMDDASRPFTKVDDIIEQQTPGWRGVPISEALTPEVVAYRGLKGPHFVPPQGESSMMVQRRVSNWIEREIVYNEELVKEEQSLTVAVVGHGNASRALFQYILGFDSHFLNRISLDNTSISRFIFNHYGWSLVTLNDASHLGIRPSPSFENRT